MSDREDETGIRCPRCGGDMGVKYTKKGSGCVKRGRKCKKCNYIKLTKEN